MMTTDDRPGAASRSEIVAVLVLVAVSLPFANGRLTIPVAAWLAPLFLLRFIRSQSAMRGLPIGWLALSVAWSFQFRGMAPVPGLWYFVLAGVYGLVGVLPFVADRLLAPRLRGFQSTLVLPCAWVVTEFVVASLTPYGSWSSAAYSQYDNLALLQVLSITGLYGVSFLIAWFAAVGNWIREGGFAWPVVGRGAATFALILTGVWIYGGVRLTPSTRDAPTVRVASVTNVGIDLFPDAEVARRAMSGTLTDDELEEIRRRGDSINDGLLQLAAREAVAGAKIVFWGETAAFAMKPDEPELIRRAGEVARRHAIYLGLGVAVWNAGEPKPLENKIVLLDPRGEPVLTYFKAIPVPGPEATISRTDDGRIKSVQTPHGRVGTAICFDMDFPRLLAQAGRQDVDLLLVPSNDWRAIDPWHTHMARLRAVEQGFNMVRHVSGGLSLAADYRGRILAGMDHYTASDRVLVAQVPTRGVRTVYSRIGDAFAWLCLAGLVSLGFGSRLRTAVESRRASTADLAGGSVATR